MEKWPTWTPTPEHIAEFPKLVKWQPDGMPGGPENPMGARALYLYQGDVDTIYRIHGTHDPEARRQEGRRAASACSTPTSSTSTTACSSARGWWCWSIEAALQDCTARE